MIIVIMYKTFSRRVAIVRPGILSRDERAVIFDFRLRFISMSSACRAAAFSAHILSRSCFRPPLQLVHVRVLLAELLTDQIHLPSAELFVTADSSKV